MYYNEKVEATGVPIERVRMLTPNGNPVQGLEEEEPSRQKKDDEQDRKDRNEKSNNGR